MKGLPMAKVLSRIIFTAGITLLIAVAVAAAPLSDEEIRYLKEKQEITFAFQPAHAPFEFIQKANRSGMNDYLSKPVSRKQLTAIINQYCS